MLLPNQESLRFNPTHQISAAVTNGNRGGFRLMPANQAYSDKAFAHEVTDLNCVLKRGDYSIRLTDPEGKRNEVSALIKRMYSWRGYNTENTATCSDNQTTLEAFSGPDLVGTLTLRLDSEDGLLADEIYEENISIFRKKDRKICELSKLAIDPQFSSKELLAYLFNLAYICGRVIHKATDFFIEVNPRHTAYYKRMLGFRQIGEVRNCQRVNAPAVLLHLELDYVDIQVSLLAGLRRSRERSLYPYFLPQHEEKKVANRILRFKREAASDCNALCG
jgi:hypothetical protein